ncbi:hypothetical protein [Streptomyces sp. NPDC006739]|uniref:hypothetical protein n=1 Tax=Streptomyces sp. NPDC006739 TaxID=3364763 RepID=UPI00368477CD
MAQAAPASGGTARRRRTPDVFDERTHARARIATPVLLGLVYGYWAAANLRSGGPITGWNLLFGFVTALVFAVLCLGIQAVAPRLPREAHAVLWAVFAGCAFGFLYVQTGASALQSVGWSLAVAGVAFTVLFYWYYTHEDAAGRRIR